MIVGTRDLGQMLRTFRSLRGMSQQSLASRAGVSARHLSFVETGRSEPSRELVHRLSRALEVPARERALMFEAAGYAPPLRRARLDDAALAGALSVVQRIVAAHAHCPAVAVDRKYDLVLANPCALAFASFVTGSRDPARASNLARFTFVELAPHVSNFDALAGFLLARMRHELAGTSDASFVDELAALAPNAREPLELPREPAFGIDANIHGYALRFLTAITTLGTPLDVTLQELRIETLMPLDEATDEFFRGLARAALSETGSSRSGA